MLSQVVFLCLLAPAPDATGEPPLPPFIPPAPRAAPSPAAPTATPSPGDTFGARAGRVHSASGVCSAAPRAVPFEDTFTRALAAGLGYPVRGSLVVKGKHHWHTRRRTGHAAVGVATLF